jgi:CBS domain-containing protein
MAAMLGGTMRAPLTGALFAVELTGDMQRLPALLAATGAAYAVTVLLLRRSMLTEKIARRGQHISREYGVDPLELARVGEVMVRDVETLPFDLPVPLALETLEKGQHRVYPVVDKAGRPVGLVSRADALRWEVEGDATSDTVADRVSDASLPVLHPDDVALRAVELMLTMDQGRLAVTDPATGALVGLLTRKDLLRVRATVARSEGERRAFFRASGARGS